MTRVNQVFGNIKTDTARTDNSDALTDGLFVQQHVDVREHISGILPGDFRVARLDAGSEHDVIVFACGQRFRAGAIVQVQRDAGDLDATFEVT